MGLPWGSYSDGTYTMTTKSGTLYPYSWYDTVGSSGAIVAFHMSAQMNDEIHIVIPDGLIKIKFLADLKVQISGTTEIYRVRSVIGF